ncbi:hypothetical protein IC582_017444 [Cucumis melo]
MEYSRILNDSPQAPTLSLANCRLHSSLLGLCNGLACKQSL